MVVRKRSCNSTQKWTKDHDEYHGHLSFNLGCLGWSFCDSHGTENRIFFSILYEYTDYTGDTRYIRDGNFGKVKS